jgi:hypothetical protein
MIKTKVFYLRQVYANLVRFLRIKNKGTFFGITLSEDTITTRNARRRRYNARIKANKK